MSLVLCLERKGLRWSCMASVIARYPAVLCYLSSEELTALLVICDASFAALGILDTGKGQSATFAAITCVSSKRSCRNAQT